MPPIILKGENLGQKHQHFNTLVNKAIKDKIPFETIQSEYCNYDIDQLFKIDIANNYRNVDYILKVLKSEDMLLVSRAIKNISWLITDEKHENLINPEYLHLKLFPYMSSKAICKLLLHIKLKLKDCKRVDEFYKYFQVIDIKVALKWLPNCSLDVIEKAVIKHHCLIKPHLFKRLCERSPNVFQKFIVKSVQCYYKPYLQSAVFLLQTDTLNYLNTLEKLDGYYWPMFSKRSTARIMKKCPEKILTNMFSYFFNVNINTVAKHVEREKAKGVVLSIIKTSDLSYWFSYRNITPFIKQMPNEGNFEFLKSLFIDKVSKNENNDDTVQILEDRQRDSLNSENIYQWYRHAPFDIAFIDMKKLIRKESSPDERVAILKVMLTTAGRDKENIYKILRYYHDEFIKEPFKHKMAFTNTVISHTNTHEYNEDGWEILEDLFRSAEVYSDCERNVQNCIEAILVYKIVHDQNIPQIIENKFRYNTLKHIKNKLNENDKNKVFKYLYNYITNKNQSMIEDDPNKLINSLDLLLDWNKDLANYPFIVNMIKDAIGLKQKKKIDINLSNIYNKNKAWRRTLFEESLILSRHESVYLNAIKHDPTLFERHVKEVDTARCDDHISMSRLLSKLKIYWHNTLSLEWAEAYRKLMDKPKGNKAVVRGLCMLLPYKELLQLLDKFAPYNTRIIWKDIDEQSHSLCKHLGQLMYTARPAPPVDYILRYAAGDYFQYSLSSLNSTFYSMSSRKCSLNIAQLLNSNIDLKIIGIRVAFAKLTTDELKEIFRDMWKCDNNILIRVVIFEFSFKLLCREKNSSKTKELWELLQMFLENLSCDENPKIYKLLQSVDKVPESVRSKFCMMSYTFLKTLPPKANCHNAISNVAYSTANLMDSIDPDFVSNILLDYIDELLFKKKIIKDIFSYPMEMNNVFYNFILCTNNESEQNHRYEKVLGPWLNNVFLLWDHIYNNDNVVECYFNDFLKGLFTLTRDFCLNKKYLNSVNVFKKLQKELHTNLPIERYYYNVTFTKLIIAYLQCYEIIKEDLDVFVKDETKDEIKQRYIKMWSKMTPLFALKTVNLLNDDINNLFPSIQCSFNKCFADFYKIARNDTETFIFENELLKDSSFIPAYLLSLTILPKTCYSDEKDKELNKVRRLIVSHSSLEVKIPYYIKYDNYPIIPLDKETN